MILQVRGQFSYARGMMYWNPYLIQSLSFKNTNRVAHEGWDTTGGYFVTGRALEQWVELA